MLKAFDDLERAVGRLVEKAKGRGPDSPVSGDAASADSKVVVSQVTDSVDQTSEEAAELIRRAIKRLKSL